MKTLFALVLLIAQFWISGYLLLREGWVSALVFFLLWMVFIGLALRVADLADALWHRLFGRS